MTKDTTMTSQSAAPVAAEVPDTERAAFEAWCDAQGFSRELWIPGSPQCGYANTRLMDYWEGWKARAALAAQPAAEPVAWRYRVPVAGGGSAWTFTQPQPELLLETQPLYAGAPAAGQAAPQAAHPDDAAVDRFAAAMKTKMAASRATLAEQAHALRCWASEAAPPLKTLIGNVLATLEQAQRERDAAQQIIADAAAQEQEMQRLREQVEQLTRERDEARAAVLAEREACAQIAESEICGCCWSEDQQAAAVEIAAAIRARGAAAQEAQ